MPFRDLPYLRWLSVFIIGTVVLVLVALLGVAIQRAREDARKLASKNNLRQIALSLHNYHDVHKTFPPGGTIRENGTALHGWTTQLWPYIDANPYYNLVNDDQPWEDRENRFLFRVNNRVWRVPGVNTTQTQDGYYLAHYLGNPNVFHRNSQVTLEEMTEGTSHNLLAGEVSGNYHPWGYPFNWRTLALPLNQGSDSFGRPSEDGAQLLLADGSVRFLANDVDEDVVKRLVQAPPVAPPERKKIPSRRFSYGQSSWERTYFDLDEDQQEGLGAVVRWNGNDIPQTVLILSQSKVKPRPATADDLKQIANAYPGLRELFGASDLDDAALKAILKLKHLEVLEVEEIRLSEQEIESLSQLRHLEILIGTADEDKQAALSEALPGCELRLSEPKG